MPLTPETWRDSVFANTRFFDTQDQAQIVQLDNGNVLVAWRDANNSGAGSPTDTDIIGRIFDPLGNAVGGDFRLNWSTFTAGFQTDPSITALSDGGFLVAYKSTSYLALHEFSATGSLEITREIADGSGINDPHYNDPVVASVSATSAMVAYTRNFPFQVNEDIFVKVYNPANNTLSTQTLIFNDVLAGDGLGINDVAIAGLNSGKYVVAFSDRDSATDSDIKFQLVNSNGTTSGSTVSVSANSLENLDTAVVALEGGGFVVAWTHGAANSGIRLRIYNDDGTVRTNIINPLTTTNGVQKTPALAALADGGFVVSWDDDTLSDLKGQRYNADGTKPQTNPLNFSSEFTFDSDGDQSGPAMVGLEDGRFAAAWSDNGDIRLEFLDTRDNANSPAVYPDNWQIGTIGDDTFTAFGEIVHGWDGDDIITEGSGAIDMFGDRGNDTIVIFGVSSNQSADGGVGFTDTLAGNPTGNAMQDGTTYDLAAGTTRLGGTTMITTNFENVTGTGANENLIGDSGNNVLDGAGGNDFFRGGQGQDFMLGGPGNDVFGIVASDIVAGEGILAGADTDTIRLESTGLIPLDLMSIFDVEVLQFWDLTAISGNRTASLRADQFGSGFSLTTLVDGNVNAGAIDIIDITMGGTSTLDLSGLTFKDWTNLEDFIRITGDASQEIVIGSIGMDVVDLGAGNDLFETGNGGDDNVMGGSGDDSFQFRDSAGAGILSLDGGANSDRLLLRSSGPTAMFDFTGDNFANMEEIEFVGDGANKDKTASFASDVFDLATGGFSPTVLIDSNGNAGSDDVVVIKMAGDADSVLDISGWTFQNWGNVGQDDKIIITGSAADETIASTIQQDIINAGSGMDTVVAGPGDDIIIDDENGAAANTDSYNGGAGNDTLLAQGVFWSPITEFNLTTGFQTVTGGIQRDTLFAIENLTISGDASIIGDGANNILTASDILGAGDNTIDGMAGDDLLIGGLGDDDITGGSGFDTTSYANAAGAVTVDLHTGNVSGADGTDTLSSIERAIGSAFDDQLRGSAFVGDTLEGGGGNDTLVGRGGLDTMIGGAGDDSYFVQQNGDIVTELLGEGNDTVRVYFDNYTLTANVEEGRVVGSANILFGNELDNRLAGGGGGDELHGGGGNDTLTGNGGGDTLFGDAGDDRLIGSAGADTLNGGADDDRLEGNGDIDTLNGNDGDDDFFGGGGRDFMTGGLGADRFIFDDADFGGNSFATADRILDFNQAENDSIDMRPTDADTTIANDQAFTFIAGAAFSGTAGELRFIQSGGRTYVQGDTDGDGTSDFMIRLEGLHVLDAGDFLL